MQRRKLTTIGILIKKTLIEKGMTQIELAEKIGTSNKYLNLIIYGDRSGKKYLNKIAKVLEIEINDLKRTA
jgi:transcriptional regulator with XRE-family HTH domain